MTISTPTRVLHAEAGSFRIRYLEKVAQAGAPVIVLLHDGAWGASADVTWDRTLSFIPDDLRVIAPDLLGFGGSDKVVFLDRSLSTEFSWRCKQAGQLASKMRYLAAPWLRGFAAKARPPPTQIGLRMEPARAWPVPFWFHGFLPPPRTSAFVSCAFVPARPAAA